MVTLSSSDWVRATRMESVLRSNRLSKGLHVDDTVPPVEDIATIHFTVVGGDPARSRRGEAPRPRFRG